MKYLLWIFCVSIAVAQPKLNVTELENGDLLFEGNSTGNLSRAINQVTQTGTNTNFSHIALVEKTATEIWVLHAAPENGSERILLSTFLDEVRKDNAILVVYRIKQEFNPNYKRAISKAKSMLGKPYNFTYVLSDSAYYCSDFVFRAFEDDSIFEMKPMTFKNQNDSNFNESWIEFYKKLKMEIPEGKPGCNPNGMANSEKLTRIGQL